MLWWIVETKPCNTYWAGISENQGWCLVRLWLFAAQQNTVTIPDSQISITKISSLPWLGFCEWANQCPPITVYFRRTYRTSSFMVSAICVQHLLALLDSPGNIILRLTNLSNFSQFTSHVLTVILSREFEPWHTNISSIGFAEIEKSVNWNDRQVPHPVLLPDLNKSSDSSSRQFRLDTV